MVEIALPDAKDLKVIIMDYVDTVTTGIDRPVERATIAKNCERPFLMLLKAWELALSMGEIETSVIMAFVQDINKQSQAA